MLPLVSAPAYAPEPEWGLNHERSVQSTASWGKRPAPSSAPVLAKGAVTVLATAVLCARRPIASFPCLILPWR